jgi:hypothetical protein
VVSIVGPRILLLAGVVLLAGACAIGPLSAPPLDGAASTEVSAPAFSFATDTFAFPNMIRSRNPDAPDLYANYCFVLARGLRQFHRFATFDPGAPKLDHAGYVERVREIAARAPWRPRPARSDRIVVPGYANLREFSAAQESAVKEGLGPRFWTLVNWTNWRVTFYVTRAHQENVAREILEELRAGRLVQLLVTNLPKVELNHTVVAYEARDTGGRVDFTIWDPNNPDGPGVLSWRRDEEHFWATRVYDTEPGDIRVFRMYYSWFL